MESTSDNVRKSRLPGLIEAMAALGICVLMMIRKEYVFTNLSSYFITYGAGIIVGALIVCYVSRFIPKDYPRRISLIVMVFIFVVLLTAFIIGEINYRFDDGLYIPEYAVVTDMNHHSSRRSPLNIYTMTVEHKGTEYTFRVTKKILRSTDPGNHKSIIRCNGFLGMEYVDLLGWGL